VVSQILAKLDRALWVKRFDSQPLRMPVLTVSGRALIPTARWRATLDLFKARANELARWA